MQYRIDLLTETAESQRFSHLLADEDPSAVVDRAPDGGSLRLSTCLTRAELQVLAQSAGLAVAADAIRALPSECCGGCGG